MLNSTGNRLVDTALQIHRVHASGYRFHAFANNRLGQNGRSGGAVAGHVRSLRRNFLDHLRTHVFELVFQFDFLGNRYTVFSDGRCAKALVENDVTSFRAQGNFYRVGQDIYAIDHARTRIITKFYVFCTHLRLTSLVSELFYNRDDVIFAHDQQFFAVDLDFGAGILAEVNSVTHLYIQGAYIT